MPLYTSRQFQNPNIKWDSYETDHIENIIEKLRKHYNIVMLSNNKNKLNLSNKKIIFLYLYLI